MLEKKFSLLKLNKFKVECIADEYFSFTDTSELDEYARKNINNETPYFVLGGGSNVLFSKDLKGLVIHPQKKEIEKIDEDKGKVLVRAHAGLNWDEFVGFCSQRGWHGLENLTLIPGNVGAAPVQNIGAYGTEVSEWIQAVHCYDINKKRELTLTNKECSFSYRHSIFKESPELIILAVDFLLYKSQLQKAAYQHGRIKGYATVLTDILRAIPISIQSITFSGKNQWKPKFSFIKIRDLLALTSIPVELKRNLVRFIRLRTLPNPDIVGNVGCFFKSPIVTNQKAAFIECEIKNVQIFDYTQGYKKISAGDLIKACGWAGKKVGSVGVDAKRPIVLLNHGTRNGLDIYNLSQQIQQDVEAKFQIKLEPEAVIK
ncbi:FAD-binding protein [Pseudomonas sp. TCU-HL1]|uniref:FAD-binding protein n=1 Tax=Pseudomonas sp. TCU-HL1 TaxID=1856685 RepID=UPI00083CFAA9|nr:FAD-binding protein [Pseudomonas sp. TCU-HL1]AOE83349.1 hypothetical protein THL1_801 [Pseudomonas sp. TCU-HL1]